MHSSEFEPVFRKIKRFSAFSQEKLIDGLGRSQALLCFTVYMAGHRPIQAYPREIPLEEVELFTYLLKTHLRLEQERFPLAVIQAAFWARKACGRRPCGLCEARSFLSGTNRGALSHIMLGYKMGDTDFMKTLLALICFVSTLLHGFFGYYLYLKGEGIFQPDGMVIAIEKKAPNGLASFDIFRSKSAHIQDPQVEDQAKNAAKYHAPTEALPSEIKSEATSNVASSTAPASAEVTKDLTSPAPESKEGANVVLPGVVKSEDGVAQIQAKEEAKEAKTEYLPFSTGWIGLLQIENALVGLLVFLLGCAVVCVKGKGAASRWVFSMNLVFWGALSGLLYFFRPVNTPLEMIRIGLSIPQWYFIIAISGLGALLSLILFLMSFGGNTPKVEQGGESKEEGSLKTSRFSLKKKDSTEAVSSAPNA